MAYTYNDFENALASTGMSNRFSQYDLDLARNNPSAGMGLLSAKGDYLKAATDADRAAANSRAEAIRSQYGSYTGGQYGTGYNPVQTPSSFNAGTAPTYTNRYQSDIDNAYGALREYPDFNYDTPQPAYNSRYGAEVDRLLGDVVGNKPFDYDYKADPSYSAYKKQYTREGQRATADAVGSAAALTGGRPSSYAVTAGSQAGDYYAAQLSDKIPQLYDAAYNRYLQDFQTKLSKMSAAQSVEQNDYSKYLDELTQYNANRNFDYGAYADKFTRAATQFDAARGLENDDYTKYQTDLNQFNSDRNYNYGQYFDNLTYNRDAEQTAYNRARDVLSDGQTEYNNKLALAEIAAQYGDTSRLEALGLDVSAYKANVADTEADNDYKDQLAFALDAAEYGDYRYLNAMGIDTTRLETQQVSAAAAAAKSSTPSGVDTLTSGPQIENYGNDTFVVKTQKGWYPMSEAQAAEVAYAYKRYQAGAATDADVYILMRYFTENELGINFEPYELMERFNSGEKSSEVINGLLKYFTAEEIGATPTTGKTTPQY